MASDLVTPASEEAGPRPRRPSGFLTFRTPEATLTGPAITGPVIDGTPTTPLDSPPASSPSASDEPPSESPDPLDGTSSKASSADDAEVGPPRPFSKAAIRRVAREGAAMGGTIAHQLLARTEEEADAGVWLLDEEDTENIGDPVARLVSRRTGMAGAVGNADVSDIISMMLGLALYAGKQSKLRQKIASYRRAMLGGGGVVAVEPVDL